MRLDAAAGAVALEPPTGWQFVLERPGQRAVVTEVGAALRSWRDGVVAVEVALLTDACFPQVQVEPAAPGLTLTPLTAERPVLLAPGDTLAGRWGLTARGLS